MRCPTVFEKTRNNVLALLAITALGFGGLAATAVAVRPDAGTETSIPAMADLKETSNAFAAVTKKAAPAVVWIKVTKNHGPKEVASQFRGAPDWLEDDLLKRFFGDRLPKFEMPRQPRHSMGQGSGFIISEDGYILTNNHVVTGAEHVHTTLADGREFEAEIVGTDERSDVAVIKIDAKKLPVLKMGNSDDLQVGQWVLAVGSPFGLPGTVTSGIVSATGRSSVGIADYENFLQTDAAINPGNSGGPLLNLRGEAIGINTAIASRSGAFNGVGFAIPINMARDICDQLIETGAVTRGYLGIAIQSLTSELAESFGLEDAKGVLIGDVTKDSPADKAGLQSGDVIVAFNGKPVEEIGAFRNRVASTTPDTEVKLAVLRDGKRVSLKLTVGELQSKDAPAGSASPGKGSLGMMVKPLTEELARKYGYEDEGGVVVTHVESGSIAAQAGIAPGTVIKEIDRQPIQNMDEYHAAMKQAQEKDSVLMLLKRGGHSRFAVLKRQG